MLSIPRAPLIFKLRITTWAFEIKGGQGALMFCRWLFGASPPLISYFAMEVNCRQLKGELKGDLDLLIQASTSAKTAVNNLLNRYGVV